MPKIKHLPRKPDDRIYYLVDSCFLVNKYIPPHIMKDNAERKLIINSKKWWTIIDEHLESHDAIVYVLNACIAETFKALFKHYVKKRITYNTYDTARKNLRKDLILTSTKARKQNRHIKFHDIELNRDIIIGVDRFFELFLKNYPKVSTFDLLILSTCRYLVDYYKIDINKLVPITLDDDLWRGSKKIQDTPYVYNPNHISNYAEKIFK